MNVMVLEAALKHLNARGGFGGEVFYYGCILVYLAETVFCGVAF